MFVVPYVKLSSLLFPQLCNNLIIPVTLISELLQQRYPRTMTAHTTDTAHPYVGGYLSNMQFSKAFHLQEKENDI